MILRMLLLFACLAVVTCAEVCIEEFNKETYSHDPTREPIFGNSTYEGMENTLHQGSYKVHRYVPCNQLNSR